MNKKILFLLLLLFLASGVRAQVSHTLTGGLGFSMGGIIRPGTQSYEFSDYYSDEPFTTATISFDRKFFGPKLTLQYGFNVSDYSQLTLSGSWKGLRNSVMRFYTYDEQSMTNTEDVFFIRTNAIELAAEFRSYTDYVSQGLYFSAGLGATFLGNEILPVYTTRSDAGSVQEVKPKAFMKANYFNISIGMGFTHTFNDKHILDYGGKINYYFGSLFLNGLLESPANTPEADYREDFRTYLRLSNIQNLQRHNVFEIYVRYGITW